MSINNCTLESNDAQGCIITAINDLNLESTGSFRKSQPLIDARTKALLEIAINMVTFMVTSLAGMAANVINIIVYWKLGLKDSISLGFFALSCSDLFLVCMVFCTSVWYVLIITAPFSNVDFLSFHYVSSAWLRNISYSMSADLTAFLSLERCCCVILPFKVKVIFSRTRSALIILAILSFHFACFLPLMATQQLRWLPMPILNNPSPDDNATTLTTYNKLRVYFLPHRQTIEEINTIVTGIVTPTLSQAIVTVCIVIFIRGLRSSSKFRKGLGAATTSGIQVSGDSDSGIPKTGDASVMSPVDGKKNNAAKGVLTTRDARLVKTMILVVIIFSINNVPQIIVTYTKQFVPEFNFRKQYHNVTTVSYSILYLLSTLNATVNVFVYYNTSTRFRNMARTLFSCRKCTG